MADQQVGHGRSLRQAQPVVRPLPQLQPGQLDGAEVLEVALDLTGSLAAQPPAGEGGGSAHPEVVAADLLAVDKDGASVVTGWRLWVAGQGLGAYVVVEHQDAPGRLHRAEDPDPGG